MKTHVDMSIYAPPTDAFGVVSGELDFDILPRVGEIVSFGQPTMASETPLPTITGFSFQLRVTDVIHTPSGASFSTMVLLEPAVLGAREDAHALAVYLERGFGLGVDPF